MSNVTVTIAPGSSIRVEFADSDGGFTIQFNHHEIIVESDMPGSHIGAEGIIHHEVFGQLDEEQFALDIETQITGPVDMMPGDGVSDGTREDYRDTVLGCTAVKSIPLGTKLNPKSLKKPEERRIGKASELDMGYGGDNADKILAMGEPIEPHICEEYHADTGLCVVCGKHHGIKF